MFYPGDPFEQRKRELIAKLASGRRGGAGGGFKVGRAPGFFGRGVAPGFAGGPPGRGGLRTFGGGGGLPFQGPNEAGLPVSIPGYQQSVGPFSSGMRPDGQLNQAALNNIFPGSAPSTATTNPLLQSLIQQLAVYGRMTPNAM